MIRIHRGYANQVTTIVAWSDTRKLGEARLFIDKFRVFIPGREVHDATEAEATKELVALYRSSK
jgi:hypothetical protein